MFSLLFIQKCSQRLCNIEKKKTKQKKKRLRIYPKRNSLQRLYKWAKKIKAKAERRKITKGT